MTSGNPTETEVQTQWRNAVALLEGIRNYADTSVVGTGGLMDTLMQSLEGDFTPQGLTSAAQRLRSGLSALVDNARANEFLQPVLYEYAKLLPNGSGYRGIREIVPALYEHFKLTSKTVKSRAITFDTTATINLIKTNVGNGAMARLTVDENNFPLEFCTVEKKLFRCRQDRNTGTPEHAEIFEHIGSAAAIDGLGRYGTGSGDATRLSIRSQHAGTGNGGSILRNSSFDTYSASASPKFQGWTEVTGGSQVQSSTTYYRGNPSSTTNGSLRMDAGAATILLRQSLVDMRISRIEPNAPYFLRLMVNKTVGSAVGGNLTVRLGGYDYQIALSSIGSGWQEIVVATGADCWPRTWLDSSFAIEIEWASQTSGYLLVDDAIFCEWDRIDGTYWCLRQNAASPTSWLIDDTLEFTDTGGAPTTGKIQWWLWVSGLGYLPSSGSPTFTDP